MGIFRQEEEGPPPVLVGMTENRGWQKSVRLAISKITSRRILRIFF